MAKKVKLDDTVKVLCKQEGGNIVTTVNCTPAELLGAIQVLVDTFANGAGIPYNEVLSDLIEKEENV